MRRTRRVGLDVPGAVLGTAGLTALVYGIVRGGEVGWDKGAVLGSFAAAAVLLVAFAGSRPGERTDAAAALPARARPRGAVLLIGIVLFAMFVTFFFLTQYFQIVQGPQRARGRPAAGRPGDRHDRRLRHGREAHPHRRAAHPERGDGRDPRGGPRPPDRHHRATTNAGLIALLLGFFGLAAGLGMPALTDTVMAAVPERDAGVGSAMNDVSRQLGGALGVAVIGSVVNDAYRSNLADHAGRSTRRGARPARASASPAASPPPCRPSGALRSPGPPTRPTSTPSPAVRPQHSGDPGGARGGGDDDPRWMRPAQAEAGDGTAVGLDHQLVVLGRRPELAD